MLHKPDRSENWDADYNPLQESGITMFKKEDFEEI